MSTFGLFATIAVVQLLAVASPGPTLMVGLVSVAWWSAMVLLFALPAVQRVCQGAVDEWMR